MSREFRRISPNSRSETFAPVSCKPSVHTYLGPGVLPDWNTLDPNHVMGRLGLARLPGVHAVSLVVRSPNDCSEELGVTEATNRTNVPPSVYILRTQRPGRYLA